MPQGKPYSSKNRYEALEPQEEEKEDSVEDDDDTQKNCPERKAEPSTKESWKFKLQ